MECRDAISVAEKVLGFAVRVRSKGFVKDSGRASASVYQQGWYVILRRLLATSDRDLHAAELLVARSIGCSRLQV